MRATLIFLVLLIPACGLFDRETPPEQRYLAANALFTRTVNSISSLLESGVIAPERKPEILTYAEAGNAALDAMELALATGEDDEFALAWASFSAAIESLLLERSQP